MLRINIGLPGRLVNLIIHFKKEGIYIPLSLNREFHIYPLKPHNSYAVNSTDTAIVIFPKGLQMVLLTLYDPTVHNESAVVPGFVSIMGEE